MFQYLTQHGYDVFFDFDGIGSGDFERIIIENIKARAHFLVLLTPSALERCGEPTDWLRREIETAIETKRNIIPLMFDGFHFGASSVINQLTGKLATLKSYNALPVVAAYFTEAMSRLCEKYLNVPLEMVLHPASRSAQESATAQRASAIDATLVKQDELIAEKEQRRIEEGVQQEAEHLPLEAEAQRKAEEEDRLREQERKRSEEEAKRKAEEEKNRNRAQQEAEQRRKQAQRKAEQERLREQERQTEKKAREKAKEEERKRIEEQRNRAQPGAVQAEIFLVSRNVGRLKTQPSTEQPALKQQEDKLEPGTIFRDTLKDGSQGPEMVVIPAGMFKMGDIKGTGDDSEKPVHTVKIAKPFAIGRYPITFDEYDRFASATSRSLPNDQGWGRGRQPAINVSWYDAVEYAKWLSEQTGKRYRLPTEAEWEYVARAGTETNYWWGNEMKSGIANYYGGGDTRWGGKKTSPVDSFRPNAFGLCDTAGNVLEWVQDCWNENYQGAPSDGSAWEPPKYFWQTHLKRVNPRVMRGASWNHAGVFLRSSYRTGNVAGWRFWNIGFRLAQDID